MRIAFRWNRSLVVGLALLGALLALVMVGQIWTPHDPFRISFATQLQPPSWTHPFGTDDLGRDVLSRVMVGGFIDLQVAVICVVLPGLFGTALGVVSGYHGGLVDTIIMRITDVFWAFPFYVLVIAVAGMLGASTLNLYLAFIIVNWISFARIARGETLVVRELEYVQACRVLGYSHLRILWRHVLPNVMTPVIVFAMADIVLTILAITALSFLGLGIQPPTPEWGLMIADGRNFLLDAWWIATFPGLAIVVTGVAFATLGDGLDTALRPKDRTVPA
jgi:peptide/nickel transport system permease protein